MNYFKSIQNKINNNKDTGIGGLTVKGFNYIKSTIKSEICLRSVNKVGIDVQIIGLAPKIDNNGKIFIGNEVHFESPTVRTYLGIRSGGTLIINDNCFINNGVWFGCTKSIILGKRVRIGPGVRIFDNSYHDVYQRNVTPTPKPVLIEDDAWVSTGSIILPGITIGRGSIVAAGSVVTHSVPAWTVVAGTPARVIKKLDPTRFNQSNIYSIRGVK